MDEWGWNGKKGISLGGSPNAGYRNGYNEKEYKSSSMKKVKKNHHIILTYFWIETIYLGNFVISLILF